MSCLCLLSTVNTGGRVCALEAEAGDTGRGCDQHTGDRGQDRGCCLSVCVPWTGAEASCVSVLNRGTHRNTLSPHRGQCVLFVGNHVHCPPYTAHIGTIPASVFIGTAFACKWPHGCVRVPPYVVARIAQDAPITSSGCETLNSRG